MTLFLYLCLTALWIIGLAIVYMYVDTLLFDIRNNNRWMVVLMLLVPIAFVFRFYQLHSGYFYRDFYANWYLERQAKEGDVGVRG